MVIGLTLLRVFISVTILANLTLTNTAIRGSLVKDTNTHLRMKGSTMHYAKNMVGAATANYDVSIWKRYFRLSKHKQPGRIMKAIVGFVTAAEIGLGVTVYA